MNKLRTLTVRLLRTWTVIFAALLQLGTSTLADTGDFDQIVAFGDSLMDSGNAFVLTGEVATPPFAPIPSAAYAIGGHHFSNGKTWVEVLGQALGLQRSTGPSARNPARFSNYAVGGSRARDFDRGVSATYQVQQYLGAGAASETALYIFGFGANDVRDVLQATDMATGQQIIGAAVASISNNLLALCTAGAKHIVIPNVANIGTTPFVQTLASDLGDPSIPVSASFVSDLFNGIVQQSLTYLVQPSCSETTFYTLDLFELSTEISENYEEFGFVSNQACLTFGTTGGAICSKPNSYFFWDGIHPTKAGHAIIAGEAINALSSR
ncbi:MAG: SGNH/GDSL hydrolase family protein [Woeseiaceae bacterium]